MIMGRSPITSRFASTMARLERLSSLNARTSSRTHGDTASIKTARIFAATEGRAHQASHAAANTPAKKSSVVAYRIGDTGIGPWRFGIVPRTRSQTAKPTAIAPSVA
ncbi:MAG: hypothetical protein HYY16_08135 [Planctomycetes bacterium]|nr:hypothetical protein [Planctomycetota bacterium]